MIDEAPSMQPSVFIDYLPKYKSIDVEQMMESSFQSMNKLRNELNSNPHLPAHKRGKIEHRGYGPQFPNCDAVTSSAFGADVVNHEVLEHEVALPDITLQESYLPKMTGRRTVTLKHLQVLKNY